MRRPTPLLLLALAGCGGAPPAPPPWEKGLARTVDLYPARRGLRAVRGIIHLHSVYSHDACDGQPLDRGMPAQPCHQNLRDALCKTRQDYAMLTDHDVAMADTAWDKLFVPGPGDEPVMEGGRQVGSRMACPDGGRVVVTVGGENDLMAVGLEAHVSDDIPTRHAIMNGSDRAAADAMRAAGALILVAHGESHALDQFRAVEPEGMEVYNLHANIDPKIRTAMGLDPLAAVAALGPFFPGRDDPPEPDLAHLAFAEENQAELSRFQTLLGEGRRIVGTLGTDAHENAVPGPLGDGERADSYRRMMRWFGNYLLVPDVTPAALKEALRRGRAFGAFHVLGDPAGFDWRAEQGGATFEIGDQVPVGASLVVEPPRLAPAPGQMAPAIRLRILRAEANGSATEVAASDGKAPLAFTASAAGAYRAEVRITPHHLTGYMGMTKKTLVREYVWVFGNPIYVR